MSEITGANQRALMDSLAASKKITDTAVGTTTTAATVLYGMQANVTRIAGYGDDAIVDLAKSFTAEIEQMPDYKTRYGHRAIAALDKHLRRLAGVGISDYWETENYPTYRICPEAAQIARAARFYIKPSLVFPPVTSLGSFVASGAAAGTFTDGDLIDGNLYGPADLEVIITAKGGAQVDLVATITGTDENGSTITGVATVVALDVGGTADVVPDQTGAKFQDITNVTITGGAADDAFTVRSKEDRTPSL
jgi:hypothetical protein